MVIASRSRQPNVTRSLAVGDWDVIVRVYDVLSSVSVAHTTVSVQLPAPVTAEQTSDVIAEGVAEILDSADPSGGLNQLQVPVA